MNEKQAKRARRKALLQCKARGKGPEYARAFYKETKKIIKQGPYKLNKQLFWVFP